MYEMFKAGHCVGKILNAAQNPSRCFFANFPAFIYFCSVNTIIVGSTFSFLGPISVECFNLKFL